MYDFCVNGGGMVGAALALGLVQQGYKVAIIEPMPPSPYEAGQAPDLRVSAISLASVDLLRALGAWQYIEKMRLRKYDTLSVWESPACRTDFTADSLKLDNLGYFVENRLLQLGCYQALERVDGCTVFAGQAVSNIDLRGVDGAIITLANAERVECKWLVGADGARSQVRSQARIGTSGWQYGQQALGIIVKMAKPVADTTWQQFFPSGPRAFLPMYDDIASLVWYDNADTIKQLSGLSDDALKTRVLQSFPDELTTDNDFSVLSRAPFVLTRSHASDYVRPGVVLIGDAAHTINPLAGQGVNLGFRDVLTFLKVTAEHQTDSADLLYQALKREYETPRKRDNALMMSAMDGFYLLFSQTLAPITWLRNGLLKGAQHAGPVKQQVLKYAIGMK